MGYETEVALRFLCTLSVRNNFNFINLQKAKRAIVNYEGGEIDVNTPLLDHVKDAIAFANHQPLKTKIALNEQKNTITLEYDRLRLHGLSPFSCSRVEHIECEMENMSLQAQICVYLHNRDLTNFTKIHPELYLQVLEKNPDLSTEYYEYVDPCTEEFNRAICLLNPYHGYSLGLDFDPNKTNEYITADPSYMLHMDQQYTSEHFNTCITVLEENKSVQLLFCKEYNGGFTSGLLEEHIAPLSVFFSLIDIQSIGTFNYELIFKFLGEAEAKSFINIIKDMKFKDKDVVLRYFYGLYTTCDNYILLVSMSSMLQNVLPVHKFTEAEMNRIISCVCKLSIVTGKFIDKLNDAQKLLLIKKKGYARIPDHFRSYFSNISVHLATLYPEERKTIFQQVDFLRDCTCGVSESILRSYYEYYPDDLIMKLPKAIQLCPNGKLFIDIIRDNMQLFKAHHDSGDNIKSILAQFPELESLLLDAQFHPKHFTMTEDIAKVIVSTYDDIAVIGRLEPEYLRRYVSILCARFSDDLRGRIALGHIVHRTDAKAVIRMSF